MKKQPFYSCPIHDGFANFKGSLCPTCGTKMLTREEMKYKALRRQGYSPKVAREGVKMEYNKK